MPYVSEDFDARVLDQITRTFELRDRCVCMNERLERIIDRLSAAQARVEAASVIIARRVDCSI